MDRERIKTLLLVSLFLVSIVLANQIWIELPDTFLPSFTEDLDEEYNKYSVSDIVSPEKILVNFNKSSHTIFYSDKKYNLWDEGSNILREILGSDKLRLQEVSKEEFHSYKGVRSLDYYFPENIHSPVLFKVLNVNMPDLVSENLDSINNIHINLGSETFIVLSDGDKNIRLSTVNVEVKKMRKVINDINEDDYTKYVAMADALNIDNDIYIPINMKHKLPKIEVKKEIDINDIADEELDAIVESFFDKDPNYIRRIEENNGTKIYIYNQQMLKIHNDGMIEYLNSIEKTARNRELNKSLDQAINFISNHIGWPEDAYLESMEPIEKDNKKGYRFKFSYKINGVEILLEDPEHKIDEPIEIEVFNEEVTYYKRYIKVKDEENDDEDYETTDRMLTLLETLEKKRNLEYIKQEFKEYIKENTDEDIDALSDSELNTRVLSAISDVYIAYHNAGSGWIYSSRVYKPVWVVEIKDMEKNFKFDIYSNQ